MAAELDQILVTRVLKHHVYPGAAPGSLRHVYVRLAFSDGGSTGPYYVPAEPLRGSAVLAEYMDTAEGASLRRRIGIAAYPGRSAAAGD